MQQNTLKPLVILSLALSLAACASTHTQVRPINRYSFDVYQYKLSESDFKRLNHELSAQNTVNYHSGAVAKIMTSSAYWKMVDKAQQDLYFSNYNYNFISCSRSESSAPFVLSDNQHACSYDYNQQLTKLSLNLVNYTTQQLEFKLSLTTSESSETQTLSYLPKNKFMLFYIPDGKQYLLFIINNNPLNQAWNYYNKSPQADNQLMVKKPLSQ